MEKGFCFEDGEGGQGQFSDRSDSGAQSSSSAALSRLKQTLLSAAQGRGTDGYLYAASKMWNFLPSFVCVFISFFILFCLFF